jgi:glycosyltransferase involved in cell wall biosynthesis
MLKKHNHLFIQQFAFAVLIPCFNNEEGLSISLNSIVSEDPFAVVLVDDGSRTPLSYSNLKKNLPPAGTLFLLRNSSNAGITESLNRGLAFIYLYLDTPFIARLDANDTCHPSRFVQQINYLNNNPACVLIGTWCRFQHPQTHNSYLYQSATEHQDILREMHYKCSFIHPGVIFRILCRLEQQELLKEHYLNCFYPSYDHEKLFLVEASIRETLEKLPQAEEIFYPYHYPYAEDYAFFWHLLKIGKGAILPFPATTCALNNTGISYQNRKAQLQARLKVVRTFGDRPLHKALGSLKIKLLQWIPYRFILWMKTNMMKK